MTIRREQTLGQRLNRCCFSLACTACRPRSRRTATGNTRGGFAIRDLRDTNRRTPPALTMNVADTRFRNAINRSGTRRHTQHQPGRSHTLAGRFPAQAKFHDRTTRRCAPVVADTLSLRLRPATAHSPTQGCGATIRIIP